MTIFENFSAENHKNYLIWRDKKLDKNPRDLAANVVTLRDLSHVENFELNMLKSRCAAQNFAIYKCENPESDSSPKAQSRLRGQLLKLCAGLGLTNTEAHRSRGADGVVAIQIDESGVGAGYIPYSNKALSWHTDGYYNDEQNRIRAMVLHCVRDASEGGINELLDPEIAYIRLRDKDPDIALAMMHKHAMTIPENTDPRSKYRPASIGPVFFVDEKNGKLNMRYSARSRNIIWRDTPATDKAREMLGDILQNDPMVVRHKLRPGEGVISNNVLHNRTRFHDNPIEAVPGIAQTRLLYRIRYKDRVSDV